MGKQRRPGGGRKLSKPEYSADKNLAQQMEAVVLLYLDGDGTAFTKSFQKKF